MREKELPGLTIALLSDLIDRRVLDDVLAGRDEESLMLVCEFVRTNISKPFYDEICMDVLEKLIELYAAVFDQSDVLKESFGKIKEKLEHEVKMQMTFVQVSAQVETVLAQHQRVE